MIIGKKGEEKKIPVGEQKKKDFKCKNFKYKTKTKFYKKKSVTKIYIVIKNSNKIKYKI